MYTISENVSYELIIKNSKFITHLIKVKSKEEVDTALSQLKLKYSDATHCCYAYIVDEIKKASDDNEPSGTAGIPILNVLEKNKLNYILCVVIRYFGGIKLGAGGLVRAYSKSVVECLKNSQLIELVSGKKIKFVLTYSQYKNLEFFLKQTEILSQTFLDEITIIGKIQEEQLKILESYHITYNVLENILIEKELH